MHPVTRSILAAGAAAAATFAALPATGQAAEPAGAFPAVRRWPPLRQDRGRSQAHLRV